MERRQELCQSLKGQRAVLPNLYCLFPDWTPKLHPEYARARDESTDPWIKRFVRDPSICRKLQKADFTTFAAVMCAKSSFVRLCTVAEWFTWYFIWDDLFDCGSLSHDPETITRYRYASVEYFKHVLCDEVEHPDLSEFSEELQSALRCWDEVADHIRQVCSKRTSFLLAAMIDYAWSVDYVDSIYSEDTIPSLQQYWCRRERTAGVHPVIATIPFIYGFDISGRDLDDTNMILLRKHTSYLVHIQNDMFSIRKEAKVGQFENLVPIIMLNENLRASQAMKVAFMLAQESARGFYEVVDRMQQAAKGRHRAVADIFIEGCRNIVMGLTHWSYTGERYFTAGEANEDHTIHFEL
ncbi:terpenoid synthase [Aspergillus vadensis CBS 113365]|uniref:Terpene synthase n=1 Tax=Aspergillus vadensis (strain CBS 113365 / IMI 142717 / IBT 24658) TaxID=1448311 RepID=A0A319BRF7_ASPVC|nr:terpenoid synthase [Aspergillus vadensis CBS 113365]PYH75275.1 terpenoid synthase [Aspergillus vadensis CBS 113365]